MVMRNRNIFADFRKIIRGLRWRFVRVKYASSPENPMILNATYAEDGLMTNHIPVFYENRRFMSSYTKGEKTGALSHHRGGITWRAYLNTKFAERALQVEGDYVECGVGKGLYSLTICDYLNFNKISKKFYSLDTFHGVPIEQLDAYEIETGLRFRSTKM